jgi:hypothetical protein
MAAMLPAADRRGFGPAAQAVRRRFGIVGRGSPAQNIRFRPTAICLRQPKHRAIPRNLRARSADVRGRRARIMMSSAARLHVRCARSKTIARLAAGQTTAGKTALPGEYDCN